MHLPRPSSVFLCGHSAPVESREAQSRDSNKSNIVQAYLLLPPPSPGHQTALPVYPLTFSLDGVSNQILRDCLPLHINIMSDPVQTTLLQVFIRVWVYPLAIHPLARHVFLCHPIRQRMWNPSSLAMTSGLRTRLSLLLKKTDCTMALYNLVLTRRGEFSFCSTCPTLAHVPYALQSWLCTAWMSSLSCESRQPRYLNTLTCSNTSPCTVNCWCKASADCTIMSRWCCLFVPTQHSCVLMCVRHHGSICILQRRHCGYLPSFAITT